MAVTVETTDTFDQWRQKCNTVSGETDANTAAIADLQDQLDNVSNNLSIVESIAAGGKSLIPLIIALS